MSDGGQVPDASPADDGQPPDAAPASGGSTPSTRAAADDADLDDRWTDPYRWACPRGHVFHRRFDPRGTVECYSCERTYDAGALIDRKRDTAPPWHARHAGE